MASRDDIIYMAAIVDGEGCIGLDVSHQWNTFTPYIMVGNTDPILPDWLTTTFGGRVDVSQQNPRWKPNYKWRLTVRKLFY